MTPIPTGISRARRAAILRLRNPGAATGCDAFARSRQVLPARADAYPGCLCECLLCARLDEHGREPAVLLQRDHATEATVVAASTKGAADEDGRDRRASGELRKFGAERIAIGNLVELNDLVGAPH